MKPTIIVHGGAGNWPEKRFAAAQDGTREAARIGWDILLNGGSALDAVEKATNYLEDNPLYDAGRGSYLNELGEVEMDALIVDGRDLNFGAVAAVRNVQYPISLARRVMTDTEYAFFAGIGADWLAQRLGIPVMPNIAFVTEEMYQAFVNRHHPQQEQIPDSMGTVGAVAIDRDGNIASATSTGGRRDKPRGRVGDTPIFGAGGYADNRFGGASATGVGEYAMRTLISKYAIDQIMAGKSAQEAATASAHYINSYFDPSDNGIIIVDKDGNIGAAHTTPRMAIGWIDANGNPQGSMGGGITGLR